MSIPGKLNTVPAWSWEIAKDGPWAIEFYLADENEVPLVRDATLTATFKWKGGSIDKAVDNGITLLSIDGVAQSFVSLQLTETDLQAVPDSAICHVRFREGVAPNRKTIMTGHVRFA